MENAKPLKFSGAVAKATPLGVSHSTWEPRWFCLKLRWFWLSRRRLSALRVRLRRIFPSNAPRSSVHFRSAEFEGLRVFQFAPHRLKVVSYLPSAEEDWRIFPSSSKTTSFVQREVNDWREATHILQSGSESHAVRSFNQHISGGTFRKKSEEPKI